MQHDLIYFFEWRANIKKALISKKKKKKGFFAPLCSGFEGDYLEIISAATRTSSLNPKSVSFAYFVFQFQHCPFASKQQILHN